MKKPSKRLPVAFNINTGLDDSKVVLHYPKDPVEIGKVVVDGNLQPVFVEPLDLIPTPDQKLAQAENMRGQARAASVLDAQWDIAAAVEAWLGRCIQELFPGDAHDIAAVRAWLQAEDISYLELPVKDGVYEFVLRRGDRELSKFTAKTRVGASN